MDNATAEALGSTTTTTQEPKSASSEPSSPHLEVAGWRRTLLLTSIFVGLFLSFLDTTIVSLALTTISAQFNDFNHSTWVITAYLLTYMAFAIIISRLSDILGRKAVEVASFLLFIGFSLGCALSRSMTELIVFRALQGIGGSGLYSMTMIVALDTVPPRQRSMISGVVGMIMISSGVLGPVLSGVITGNHDSSTWRWIFYLNIPLGGLALLTLLIVWPRDKSHKSLSWTALRSIDYLGSILLLAASVLLIFALQEAGASVYAWSSGTIIACLTTAAVTASAFVLWQQYLARRPEIPVKLVFPVSVARKRVMASAFMVTLLSGFNFYIAVVNLPQRFQIVDRDGPVIAGVKLLPMMGSSAVGSLAGGVLNSKRNMTAYTLIASAAFQLLGYGLMSSLGNASPTPQRQFGFQVFLGLGVGLAMLAVTIMGRLHAESKWMAVTQGALTQMRSLGGSLGLAIGVIVFNGKIRASVALHNALDPGQMSALLRSPLALTKFNPEQQKLVSRVYATAFTKEMQVATYIAAACLIVSLLTIQRHPPPVAAGEAEIADEVVGGEDKS